MHLVAPFAKFGALLVETFYLIIVVCLLILAVSDLVVGVSNDAVNFLNSALGSKAGSRKTIMIVATVGILFGAMSSGGMMEVARKGIFHPEMFSFADIMVLFLAVMITDIILLDLFNTFGMPTSTTVSITFELLGAAFAVACIKLLTNGESIAHVGDFLNSENAGVIISGIFISVAIAFSIGTMVQYFVRMLFSFDLERTMQKYGPVFGGLAITIITYFLLVKGFEDSSLVSTETNEWIEKNTLPLIGILLVFWIIVCYLLVRLAKVNVLKIVVLSGTFSLAMAFAGNDLVNFIGVPIAGLQAFNLWQDAGVAPDAMQMTVLGEEARAPFWMLIVAGLVMVATLWLSKKARSVTETEINLARESVGTERFHPNTLSRWIVRGSMRLGAVGSAMMSEKMRAKIDARFVKSNEANMAVKDQPAFDLVRASVNLMVASILIASATSMKLPLSTTYVSFMVAMGTSLADRAWNRDSAVYRVAGVVNVITGWLFTAFVAFSSAAILAVIIYHGGIVAVVGLMAVVIFLIIRSQVVHRRLEKKKVTSLTILMERDRISSSEVFKESENRISQTLGRIGEILKQTMKGLSTEDRRVIARAKTELENFNTEYDDLSASFYYYLKKIDSESAVEGQFYLHVLNYLQNISQSVDLITEKAFTHVRNMHKSVQKDKLKELTDQTEELAKLCKKVSELMGKEHKGSISAIEEDSKRIRKMIAKFEKKQISRVKKDKSSAKNSLLYITILLESRDILNNFMGLVELYENKDQALLDDLGEDEEEED